MNTRENRRRAAWAWLAGFAAAASCLFLTPTKGQTPQAPPSPAADGAQASGPAIKAESRLVLVDAVVTDKKGNYVHDLTLDAAMRGRGQGRAVVPLLFSAARSLGLSHLSLVAVNRRGPFWQAAGFSATADAAMQAAAQAKYGAGAVHMEREL